MNANQVNKLYTKLTPQEQAGLVFEAAVNRDESQVDAILNRVERKTYIAVHADYARRIHELMTLVGQYGIEYWKNRTLMLLACEQAEKGVLGAEENANKFFTKTVALEIAMINVCKSYKVDVAAIKNMASCPVHEAEDFDFPEVDAQLVQQYTELFLAAIPNE